MSLYRLLFFVILIENALSSNFKLIEFDFDRLKETEGLCQNQFNVLDNATIFKMFDASAKFLDSIEQMNFYNLGNFDECYNIASEITTGTAYGKYCLGNLPMSLLQNKEIENSLMTKIDESRKISVPKLRDGPGGLFSFRLGVCFPSGCSAKEIQEIFNNTIQFSEDACYSQDTAPELTAGAIATITVLAIFFGFVILSTAFDITLFYLKTESPHGMLIAFSAFTNGRKLITPSTNRDQILCLNGLKAISMMWVIIGHSYINSIGGPIGDFIDVNTWPFKTINMIIISGTLSVDTFFVVGGLVTVYTFLKASDKGEKFNIFLYYIHRYIRLTPALAIVVVIHITLLKHFGNGPMWNSLDTSFVEPCKDYWWSALLYIQNYVHGADTCVPQTWYLSIDFQLFLLSPIILLPLKRWPHIGLGILAFSIIAGFIVPFVVGYVYELPAYMTTVTGGKSFMWYYYKQTHARFGPYVIGMLAGYLIYKYQKNQTILRFNHTKAHILALVILGVSLGGLLTCVFATHDATVSPYDRWAHTFSLGFLRNSWAICVCGIILVCVAGFGGPIDWFLSLPIFQFLCKLSYSMYLTHYALISMRYASSKLIYYLSNTYMMWAFWGDFMWTLLLSVVLCLTFESPMIIIEKFIFGTGRTRTTNTSPVQQNTPEI